MTRLGLFLLLAFTVPACLPAADDDLVFRSDVSLVRVDAQVVDRDNRALTNLTATDFVLRENGQAQEIRNFSREDTPLDVLFLLDVSGSMKPHVQRIADASHEALQALGEQDRVAIMVFDRQTRIRLPFRSSRADVERGLETLLNQETFDGGTDITRSMLDASYYIARNARKGARRAIVILTDDETERERDVAGVGRALVAADTVMSALLTPDVMQQGGIIHGGGGGYPGRSRGGGGVVVGGPLGGIIFGRGGNYPGGGGGYPGGRRGGGNYPGGGGMGNPMQSAGTAEIARESGGDSMDVSNASALEDTLERLRERYALHFYLPEGVKPGQERQIEVALSPYAQKRYPYAEVRYRRTYMAPEGTGSVPSSDSEPVQVTRAGSTADPSSDSENHRVLRRPPADESGSGARPSILTPDRGSSSTTNTQASQGGWRRDDSVAQAPRETTTTAPASAPAPAGKKGGWRRATAEDQ